MSELVFTAPGQAEVLAAQESIAAKGREMRAEFEEGAKATKTWTSELGSLRSAAESGLRSIQTEQEKIAGQIAAISEAQEKGLIPPERAEVALRELRQRWIDIDDATVAAKKREEEYAAGQEDLKNRAVAALGSVKTELERIEDQIDAVEAAAEAGLIPPEEAAAGIDALKVKYGEVKAKLDEASTAGDNFAGIIAKAFDPMMLTKWLGSFAGLKAIIAQIRTEFEDLQTAVDKRAEAQMTLGERAELPVMGQVAAGLLGGAAGYGFPGATDRQRGDYRRYLARRQLEGTFAGGVEDLSRLGDPNQLTTKELDKLTDVLRANGQGDLARRFSKFVAQLDDGTVSVGEVAEEFRRLTRQIQIGAQPASVQAQFTSEGGDVLMPPPVPVEDLPPLLKEQVTVLNRMADALERIEGYTREGGGLPVDGS